MTDISDTTDSLPDGVQLRVPRGDFADVLTGPALAFVAALVREFRPRIDAALRARVDRHRAWDEGATPDFLPETADVRAGSWRVAPIPDDLQQRRVEITGPVDPKMVINALNSGASCFMADFEDATAPTWRNQMTGQRSLMAAVRRTLTHHDPVKGKDYALRDEIATLLIRPRGLHLPEAHVFVDGGPAPGCLVDFGLYLFHNGAELLRRGSGPYLYLPKLEHHLEARLWNDVFVFTQDAIGIPQGSIRATVLIETLPAAFQMDEILHELRDHSAGLNCGRWDYIFSYIKTLRAHPQRVLPDRGQVTMTQPNMMAYAKLAIETCHRRGIHAMGGMAAQIPIKTDPEQNRIALDKVRADKRREVELGHDGTWVAHPGLVGIAREIFEEGMPGPNQIDAPREPSGVTAADLLEIPTGTRTEAGLRTNIRVGIQYLEAWLRGNGCVPLYNLMEDAATAEISRAQVWQWLHHGAALDDGRLVTAELFHRLVDEELDTIRGEIGDARFDGGAFADARTLFESIATADELPDFLTTVAYPHIATPTQ